MNKDIIIKSFNKVMFTIRKHSPEILTGLGIAGGVGATVLACKATIKAKNIISESKELVANIHDVAENPDPGETYTDDDIKKAIAITYAKTGLKLAKEYAPAVIIGSSAIFCVLASNGIMDSRNAALSAAYATVNTGFKKYRDAVIDKLGEDADKEFRFGIKPEKITETSTDENGKTKKTKKTEYVANEIDDYSEYARMWDCGDYGWTDDPESNLEFLISNQRFCNKKLEQQGHLFLNEVYDVLGFKRTKAGQAVGWVYNKDSETGVGDNYVDFGIYNVKHKAAKDFVNGIEPSIILDFNVQGPIWDLI